MISPTQKQFEEEQCKAKKPLDSSSSLPKEPTGGTCRFDQPAGEADNHLSYLPPHQQTLSCQPSAPIFFVCLFLNLIWFEIGLFFLILILKLELVEPIWNPHEFAAKMIWVGGEGGADEIEGG